MERDLRARSASPKLEAERGLSQRARRSRWPTPVPLSLLVNLKILGADGMRVSALPKPKIGEYGLGPKGNIADTRLEM